jgi:hypothetical protein
VRLCAITLVAAAPPAVITLLFGLHHQPEVSYQAWARLRRTMPR